MSLFSRLRNVFRSGKLDRDLAEEMEAHIADAIESGRNPEEARRAFGSRLRSVEASRDIKLLMWLECLRADAVFGWRQLMKNRLTSGAAMLSLALAIGACTSAFRLIDAVLLRPLPVAHPESLYFLAYVHKDSTGKTDTGDSFQYPLFRDLRQALTGDAELMAISYCSRIELTYGGDADMERAHRQYVSGWTFRSFGLKPAAGRLLTEDDDRKPGAHPMAVLSYDYWTRRFGRDPKAVGRTLQIAGRSYEIVGVSEEGFTGTETGTPADLFIPTMMNERAINDPNWGWFRTWVRVNPGVAPERVRQKLLAGFTQFRREKSKEWSKEIPKEQIEDYVNAPLQLQSAAAGVSGLQKNYRQSLLVLGVVVGLVLLIACANLANLMTAQAASRSREMALRVSIGAGRWRLVQLVMVESALVALSATVLGGLFAAWSAPLVVGMINPPDNPARLYLPADWRVLGFAAVLALLVTILFGLAPALRASAVKPMAALKGGDERQTRRRLMNSLIAAQVAFCFLVHFIAGLFVATFDRLSSQPTGFSSERLLTLDTSSKGDQPIVYWNQITDHLRSLSGVESAALCGWPLMSGNGWSSHIWVGGRLQEGIEPYFLSVSPGWFETMKIGLLDGREFRQEDTQPTAAIVNEAFAKRYFNGENPVGKSFEQMVKKVLKPVQIVGYVRDARYRNMREPIRPTIYVPMSSGDRPAGAWAAYIVRTSSADPMALAPLLRAEVKKARSEFRVSNIRTQQELVEQHTVRERLLAMLSLFFAVVALVLAGVGLYGVLSYSVVQRQREIGIRMALGAQGHDVAGRVLREVCAMLLLGAAAGLAAGIASESYIETLLYGVRVTDFGRMALPVLTIFAAALLAALPPVIHAVRMDPAVILRSE